MKAFSLLLFVDSVCAQPTLVLVTPPTQTTAVFGILGYSGSCTLALSESPSLSPLHPDVNGAEYSGANVDTSRPDTYNWTDNTRIVQFGHNTGDRALAAATTYYLQVSGCGGTAAYTFTTPTVSNGTNQQWPVPFDATHPWNYGYPLIDLLNRKAVVDPVTGVKMMPINLATDFTWRTGTQPYQSPNCCAGGASPFTYFAGGSGWTNPLDISNGTPSGSTSDAGTGNTNPLDMYGVYTRFLGGGADDPWGGITFDDLGIVIYGSASNQSGGNNQVTLCIFTNPNAGCLGTPVTVTMPSQFGPVASSGSDADKPWPASFPSPFFSGWGLNAPLGPDHVNTQGVLNAVAGVLTDTAPSRFRHFPSTMAAGQKIYVAGSSPTCTNNLCTLASYQNYSQITIAENLTISNAAYSTLMWGVRIQKTTATGSVSIGAAFKHAGSRAVDQAGAAGPLCNVHGFTSGDGHFGYLCQLLPTAYAGGSVLYFLSSDGTIRPLYSGVVPPHANSSCFTPSNSNDAPNPSQFVVGGFVPDGTDPKTWYIYTGNGAGKKSLYKLVYSGDTTESLSFNYGLDEVSDGFVRNAPCDFWAWTNVLPQGNDLQTQVAARYPGYKTPLYGDWNSVAQFDGITGHFAYFDNVYSGQDGGPAWVIQLDLSSNPAVVNNLIHTADGTGTNGRVAWGAHHNTGPSNSVPNLFSLAENRLISNNSTKLHGGPFQATVLGVQSQGAWRTNTALPWPIDSSYDSACPEGNPYAFIGAVGNQCVTLHVAQGGVCNVAPTAIEKSTWPCPWNAAYAQPFALHPGNVFSDPGVQIDGEKFRIVQITTNSDSTLTVVAQRNAMWDYCCIGAKGGINNCLGGPSDNQHANGWSFMMYPPALNGCAGGGFAVDAVTGAIQEPGRLLGGHGDFFPGVTPGNAAYIGADFNQNIGSKPDFPVDGIFTLPTTYFTLKSPTFGGVTLAPGAGKVQSYPSSPGGTTWMLDANTMNGNLGLGPELIFNNIGNRAMTATGTPNVFLIQVVGTINYKLFPLLGWAGRYLLHEVSGPGSNVDSTPWTFCYALVSGECHAGSTAGQVYANVPGAGDFLSGGGGTCPTGLSWAVVPCIITGFPGGGGFRQNRYDIPDPTSQGSRLLSYVLTSPGEHYPFSGFVSLPDGKAAITSAHQLQNWGPVSFLVSLPPWHLDTVDRTKVIPVKVTIPPGTQTYAEVQFGYARYGAPGQFRCTPRGEACNTSVAAGAAPFNFESETRTLKACAGGCSISIPVVAPNLVYYRVRTSSDGVNWTNRDTIPYAVP